MRSRIALLVGACSLFAAQFAMTPQPVNAAGTCSADFAVLGQLPGLTGATPTDWFNVFGFDFDGSAPVVLTFGVPVIPYSLEPFGPVLPAVTTFSIPAQDVGSGFKWSFRSRDVGVKTISVTIAGKGCQATTLVDLAPPPTSTDGTSDRGDTRSPALPTVFVLAFAAGLLMTARRLRERG